VLSPLFYVEARIETGADLVLPAEYAGRALYVVSGTVSSDGKPHGEGTMLVFREHTRACVTALEPAHVMLIGGAPLAGERIIWWNFVSSSRERLEQAKDDWRNRRFAPGARRRDSSSSRCRTHSEASMTNGEVLVSSTAKPFEQTVSAGKHRFTGRRAARRRRRRRGPDPYALLLGALGSCTSMTLLVYARRKKWPLEHVDVRLSHAREHAEDCAECEDGKRRIERIERRIALTGPLSAEQKTRCSRSPTSARCT
jgi:uncharacterized OsmC-like protein